jgi:hypothetical protein
MGSGTGAIRSAETASVTAGHRYQVHHPDREQRQHQAAAAEAAPHAQPEAVP